MQVRRSRVLVIPSRFANRRVEANWHPTAVREIVLSVKELAVAGLSNGTVTVVRTLSRIQL